MVTIATIKMSPYLEDQLPEIPDIEPPNENIHLILTPISDLSAATSLSEDIPSVHSDPHEESQGEEIDDVMVTDALKNYVSMEHNIRELLVRSSNTEQLETVTQVRLRVIAREVALQQLGCYLPALRELVLDGSIITSLRDLGYGLRNLKILKVNRCELTCIDGVLGFEYLEELYASNNSIKDLSPCAFLSDLKVIDVRNNDIKNYTSLSFLNLCSDLKHVLLAGNEAVDNLAGSRNLIGRLLPDLQMLDGAVIVRDLVEDDIQIEDMEDGEEVSETQQSENAQIPERLVFGNARRSSLSRPRRNAEVSGFTVTFPPRVCGSPNNGK